MTSKSLTLLRLLATGRHQGNLKVPEMKHLVLPVHIQHMNKLKHIAATLFNSIPGIDSAEIQNT